MNAYRVVLIGNAFVGKTALILRYVNKAIQTHYEETIGSAFHTFQTKVDKQQCTIQVWDTAGQEKYRSLGPVYYRNTSAAILVFDLTDRQSFDDLEQWVMTFRATAGHSPLIFIVGNKADLEEERKVEEFEISNFAETHGFQYFITSAVSGFNVDFLFQSIAEKIIKNRAPHPVLVDKRIEHDSSSSEQPVLNQKSNGCC